MPPFLLFFIVAALVPFMPARVRSAVMLATPLLGGVGLLGLEEGKNFALKDKDPMPPEEELRKGVSPYVEVPPKGTLLYMTVSMELKGGKKKVMAVEDLLADLRRRARR